MKDTKRENGLDKPGENGPDDSQDGPVVSYTPEQRRLIRKGLRIWAKVAVRSYMRKHPAGSKPEMNDGGEEEAQ